jgi:hypothetical protein
MQKIKCDEIRLSMTGLVNASSIRPLAYKILHAGDEMESCAAKSLWWCGKRERKG